MHTVNTLKLKKKSWSIKSKSVIIKLFIYHEQLFIVN